MVCFPPTVWKLRKNGFSFKNYFPAEFQICQKGLDDVFNYLENEDGEVAVFDATNTTRKRRRKLYEKVVGEKGFKLFFVESICFDKVPIFLNFRLQVRSGQISLSICHLKTFTAKSNVWDQGHTITREWSFSLKHYILDQGSLTEGDDSVRLTSSLR